MIVKGMRSSCDALATNSRCPWNARPSRLSIASNVPASVSTSSRGPRRPIRASSRVSWDRATAVSVMRRSGRSARPATSQHSASDTAASPANAAPVCRTMVCSARAWAADVASWTIPQICVEPPTGSDSVCTTESLAATKAWRTSRYMSVSTAAPVTANRAVYHSASRPRMVSRETTRPL
jgi:hypothetical protein